MLDALEGKLGGARTLAQCDGRMNWPTRGVYFFFESGEVRTHSGHGRRVVRIGTHALSPNSRTALWNRLSQHQGVRRSGGGNHRGSVFRKLVGAALMVRDPNLQCSTWGKGNSAVRLIREKENPIEVAVSHTIRAMPFLWMAVADPPGPKSLRGYIERNSIALLSNHRREALDPASSGWLGRFSSSPRVVESGLWNSNHVDESWDTAFVDRFADLVSSMNQADV